MFLASIIYVFICTCVPGLTSEEATAKRRSERRQFKLDRARAMAAAAAEAEAAFEEEGRVISTVYAEDGTRIIPSAATWKPSQSPETPRQGAPDVEREEDEDEDMAIENVEHLQLTLPEAFFLLWNLDCLSVMNPDTVRSLSDRTDAPPAYIVSRLPGRPTHPFANMVQFSECPRAVPVSVTQSRPTRTPTVR